MSQVTLGGNPINVNGQVPAKGDAAPAFSLVAKDLSDATLATFAGKRKILNIFPSIDTRPAPPRFASSTPRPAPAANTVVLCISADLPSPRAVLRRRRPGNVINLSTMRGREFLDAYGVAIASGPLVGVAARAVVVLDETTACCVQRAGFRNQERTGLRGPPSPFCKENHGQPRLRRLSRPPSPRGLRRSSRAAGRPTCRSTPRPRFRPEGAGGERRNVAHRGSETRHLLPGRRIQNWQRQPGMPNVTATGAAFWLARRNPSAE